MVVLYEELRRHHDEAEGVDGAGETAEDPRVPALVSVVYQGIDLRVSGLHRHNCKLQNSTRRTVLGECRSVPRNRRREGTVRRRASSWRIRRTLSSSTSTTCGP